MANEDRTHGGQSYLPNSESDPHRSRPMQDYSVERDARGNLVPINPDGRPRIPQTMAQDLATIVGGKTRGPIIKRLIPLLARGAIPAVRTSGKDASITRQSGTGGIASPLEEGTTANPNTLQRTYHSLHVVTALDGLFTFEYKSLDSVTMVDDNSAVVVFSFEDDPPV